MTALLLLALLACAALPLLLMPVRISTRGNTREARLVSRINSLLPQTQCRECGHAGCLPYARAIATGSADIDRCPPGGEAVRLQLQSLLGRTAAETESDPGPAPVAHIDEAECIGCVKCVRACPVDAIVGAAGQMHVILARECTGCGLCVAPCPVDCITLVPRAAAPDWHWPRPRSVTAP